jgi:hypothetical protein
VEGSKLRLCSANSALTSLTCAYLFIAAAGAVHAEQQKITVLVKDSFSPIASDFLVKLNENLPTLARAHLQFDPISVPSSEIQKRLTEPWNMAIVSTFTLARARVKSSAIAFEIPFLFSNLATVTQLEHSPVGEAGLGATSNLGGTGLVYLNAGTTLIADLHHAELARPTAY